MKRTFIALLAVLALGSTAFTMLPGGDDSIEVKAEFTRAFNLFPQSPVRVLGVEVGQIIELDTRPGSDVVTVTMEIDSDTGLSGDASAVVITASLLGERYVQLTNGTDDTLLEDGATIPVARTIVPFEFDEVLEGLNDFVGGLDEDEVARLVTNLADLLEGNGEQLGETVDAAAGAIAALQDNDEELIALATAVADLNATLATRDQELALLLDDWIRVTDTLTSESTDLDGALDGLVVLTREIAELMIDHRQTLSQDVDTLTRVGRSVNRNLDNASTAILGSAELFRHAERVFDRDVNMLPLVNHAGSLEAAVQETLFNRLEGLCLGAGGDEDSCSLDELQDGLSGDGGELCIEPFMPCTDQSITLSDVIVDVVRENPSIGGALLEHRAERGPSDDDQTEEEGAIDTALEELGLLDREGRR